MSERKPFTRGGRTLVLIRPRPARAPGLLAQFRLMALRPAAGVAAVLKAAPSPGRLAWALAAVGLLRGVAEGLWYYLMTGRLHTLPALLGRADWYTRYGAPFILLNIPSAHFLWLTTAIIIHLGCRALGGQGRFRQVLQATGIALFAYAAIGLINYVYIWWRLPSITLNASAFYSPNLGLGQLLVFMWLALVCYQIARQVHGLPPLSAALAAPLPVLLSLLLYLGSAGLFFRVVPLLPGVHPGTWLSLANGAYLAATVVLSLAMAYLTRNWSKAGGRGERDA